MDYAIVNGKKTSFNANTSISALLAQHKLASDMVIVELNGEIVPADRFDRTFIKDADRIEIVHFVGGG